MFVQIRCELCGKTFDHDASAMGATAECPHCGKTNPVPALAPAPTVAPAASGGPAVKPCPACQAEIEADAVICIHCGQNLATGRKVGGRSGLAAHKSLVLAGLAVAMLAAGLPLQVLDRHAFLARLAVEEVPGEHVVLRASGAGRAVV